MSANRHRAKWSVNDWDSKFPIGTTVTLADGTETVTESHAGMSMQHNGDPAVFVRGIDEPVPLVSLRVAGYTLKTRKQR